jgi:hypothetical protein
MFKENEVRFEMLELAAENKGTGGRADWGWNAEVDEGAELA